MIDDRSSDGVPRPSVGGRGTGSRPMGRHAARTDEGAALDSLLRGGGARRIEWPPPTRWLLVVAGCVAAGAMAWLVLGQSHEPAEVSLPRADSTARSPAVGVPGDAPTTTISAGPVAHIAGAVNQPGIVHLEAGSRVADALTAAGGIRGDADLDRINLAAPVVDGERIYVLAVGQAGEPAAPAAATSSSSGAGATVVDLNSATLDQLDSLAGVGPATAKAIVDYRSQHGPFHRVEDLLDVRGIGDAKLESLRSSIRVGP